MKNGICILLFLAPGGFIVGQPVKTVIENHQCRVAFNAAIVELKAAPYYSKLKKIRRTETGLSPTSGHVLFGWPLRINGNYDNNPGYYSLVNYVDDSTVPGWKRDYSCGQRTYDGHTGIDISLWPFWWHMMNNGHVQVAAAAPGIVTDVVDNNNNNNNCTCEDNNHNYISVLHADSSKSFYVHIRHNSARVNVGDIVIQGQILADVASSGCSSNPHLHFEVKDAQNNQIDPFTGPVPAADCNHFNEESWWQNQKPYREPQINRLMTHGSLPMLTGYNGNSSFCPAAEQVNSKNSFAPGEKVFLGMGMHDWLSNTSIIFSVFYPDGSILYNNSKTNFSSSDLSFYYTLDTLWLPGNAPAGTYMFDANYLGANYKHFFTVNCLSSYNLATPITNSRSFIAASHITSNTTVATGQKVMLQAGNYIQFTPGFTAPAGATLKARIKDCNYSE